MARTPAAVMKNPAVAFFHEHAPFSYRPDKETRAQGRARCAKALANAEAQAHAAGYSFRWLPDTVDSSEFSDARPAWGLWVCLMLNAEGATVQSLSGVDFGRGGEPWGANYRRVIEAELAAEECKA